MSSTVDIIKTLPPLFSTREAAWAFSQTGKALSVYLYRAEKAGLIEKAGPRSGLYFNRLKIENVDHTWRAAAVKRLYPTAVLYGPSLLHRAGWTTQIPQALHVVVPARRSMPALYGVELYPRPLRWFKKHHDDFQQNPEYGTDGLMGLDPERCLEDMKAYQDGWMPDETDVENPDQFESMDF